MNLLPYQVDGRDWLAARPGPSLLGDDPGLGKTAQAICAVVLLAHKTPSNVAGGVLIVCPASLQSNWRREWGMWCPTNIQAALAIPGPHICSYEGYLKQCKDETFRLHQWSVAIIDEAHYCKTPKAKRTKAILGDVTYVSATGEIRQKGGIVSDRIWFLTGTPITKSPSDFYTLLHRCAPQVFNHKHFYEQRYCDGHMGNFGWIADGATNLPELKDRILDTGIMLRRLRAQVLTELPPKRRQVLELDVGTAREIKKTNSYLEAATDGMLNLSAIKGGFLDTDSAFFAQVITHMAKPKTTQAYRVKATNGGLDHCPDAHQVREALAGCKIQAFEAWLKQQIEERGVRDIEATVVWAYYHTTLDRLAGVLDTSGVTYEVFDGRTSQTKRDAAIRNFQAGTSKIFLASPAAYTGITLTAAARAVFVEYSYTPMDNEQAESRIHRIGQHNPVLIQYLAVQGSYDTYILKAMVRRMETIKTLLG